MLITNFASGELSPNLNGRVDIQQYYQGAAKIENFEIVPTGGIKRRPGTERIATLSGQSRIIPFIVDKNKVYILQFCLNPEYDPQTEGSKPGLIKVWERGVLGSYSPIATVGVDYSSLADMEKIQYAQNYDTMVFVHKDYPPYMLKVSGTTFNFSAMQFDFWPDVELDDDYTDADGKPGYIMIVSGVNFPTKTTDANGNIIFDYYTLINGVSTPTSKKYSPDTIDFYCIKDGKLWKYDNTNSKWLIYGEDPDIDTELFATEHKYPGCVAFFNNRMFFASTDEKPQAVYASAAPDKTGTQYNVFTTYKKYVTLNKVVKDADLHLFSCDLYKSDIDTVNHRITLRNVTQNFETAGVLKTDITKYYISSDIFNIGVKVISATENTLTIDTTTVTEAWGDEETVKTNLVMSIQLWRTPNTASSEDYEYIVVSRNITTADCSLFFELASDQNDAIKFMSSNRFLAIGTESSIWSVEPGISALSINAVMQGRYGSDDIQGQAVETATVYFAQGKKGIREFYYDGQNSAFTTNNIALLADHILRESAAVDFDYMTNPYSRLLIVRQDGTVAEMLYDKTNGVMAWSRLIMSKGKIKSCAVTRGEDENDLVFFVVKDGDSYFMELLDLGSNVYLDSRKSFESGDSTTGYTEGAVIYNETKGEYCPYDDIPTGFIGTGDTAYIGYLFRSYIKSMPVIGRDPSKRQRINALLVPFLDSFKPIMKCPGLADEKFTSIKDVPYSGIATVTYPGVTEHDVCFELEAEKPERVNILSIDAQTA